MLVLPQHVFYIYSFLPAHCEQRSPLTVLGSHRHCTQSTKGQGERPGNRRWEEQKRRGQGRWEGLKGREHGVVARRKQGAIAGGSKRQLNRGGAAVKKKKGGDGARVRRGVVEGGAHRGRRDDGRVNLHRFREPFWPPPKAGSKPGSKPGMTLLPLWLMARMPRETRVTRCCLQVN